MTTDLIEENLANQGSDEGLSLIEKDDELAGEVEEAIVEIVSPTKSFVKSKDVVAAMDVEDIRTNTVAVGHRLRALANRDEPPVEQWCPGDGAITWRINHETVGSEID